MNLILHSVLDIDVRILFFPAYKFFQETRETWKEGEFISIDGFTDFEDDREYLDYRKDEDDQFILAIGMDGELKFRQRYCPTKLLEYKMLEEEEVFDTQKGIVRKIV